MVTCGRCGAQSEATAKFCHECGTVLIPARASDGEERKTVTVLFCDVAGSTELGERLDPETSRAAMTKYFTAMRGVLESHGGTVEKFIGDAVMAVFGVPVVHEDDALRALRAASHMLRALDELNEDLQQMYGMRLGVRIGVNTGEVVLSSAGDARLGTVATGDAVNVAARLQAAADIGDVVFGAATYALVKQDVDADAVPSLSLEGKTAPVQAWRLRRVASVGESVRTPSPATFAGRDDDLALLQRTLTRCVASSRPGLVTVLGVAGVGKSRLVSEFTAGLASEVTVLTGRCLPYGDDIVFWPLRTMLMQAIGLDAVGDASDGRDRLQAALAEDPRADQVVEWLAPLAGLGGVLGDAGDIRWAVRRLVERLGARGPVVVVLDDAHWVEAVMLEVLDDLAEWARDTALLVICLGRPEFLDDHPTWGGGKLNAQTVLLEPLDDSAADALLTTLLAGAELDQTTRGRILSAANGMPLYVEQMTALLLAESSGPRTGLAAAAGHQLVPPTLAALLGARLDLLTAGERGTLEAASVVGTTFYLDAVAQLVHGSPAGVHTTLLTLSRKQLIRPVASDIPDEEAFHFEHAMLRDAAYGRISKRRRSELHEHIADWLDARHRDRPLDVDEFIGYHLEQAVLLRRELGPQDAHTAKVAEQASAHLRESARHLGAADPLSMASLRLRAARLAPWGSPDRLADQRRAAANSAQGGDFAGAMRTTLESVAEAQAAGDERAAVLAELTRVHVSSHLDPDTVYPHRLPEFRAALTQFQAAGDDEGMLVAGRTVISTLNELSTWRPVSDLAKELLPVARRYGDLLHEDELQAFIGAALFFGDAPIGELIDYIRHAPPAVARQHA